MNKKSNPYSPRLVKIADKHGDDLTPSRLAQELIDGDLSETVWEDLKAERHWPLDAPMETRMEEPDRGRIIGVLFLTLMSFIAGIIIGRMFS